MAHAFYMDVHVPLAVTMGLRHRGVDVLTSQEDGTQESDDEALLERATELARLLFTQDEDLLAIVSRWQQQNREFTGLAHCHQLVRGLARSLKTWNCWPSVPMTRRSAIA